MTQPHACAAAQLHPLTGSPSTGSRQPGRDSRRHPAWQRGVALLLLLLLAALAASAALPSWPSSAGSDGSDGVTLQHSRPLVRAWTGKMAAQRRLLQGPSPPAQTQQSQPAQQSTAASGDIALDGTDMLNFTRTGKSYNNPEDFPVPIGYE